MGHSSGSDVVTRTARHVSHAAAAAAVAPPACRCDAATAPNG